MTTPVVRAYEREVPEWKKRIVAELAESFRKYPAVIIADLTGVPTYVVQKVRKRFRNKYLFRVAKKNLIIKAMKAAGYEFDDDELDSLLRGQIMLIFLEGNVFKAAREIDAEKVEIPAKPGQVAEEEIVISEGMTNLSPGPILSVFGKLRIPYQVRGGKIYIAKDTVVAKPGDVISGDLAGLLMSLGIKPFKVGVKIKAAIDEGIIIPKEDLFFDVSKIESDFADAAREALGLASEIVYAAIPEAVEAALARAARETLVVAGEAVLVTPDTLEGAIIAAINREAAIVSLLGDKARELGIEAPARPVEEREEGGEKKEKEEEEKKEEGEGEEEVDLSGLGGLFGM